MRYVGLDILDWAIDDNQIETLDTIGKQKVRDMIVAAKPSATTKLEKRDFLYQIVANGEFPWACRAPWSIVQQRMLAGKNSIDTDKFDYLARDTYFMGMKSTFDFRRLMVQNRVIDGEICFHSKEVYSVQELFHTRYTLFKNCYVHRAGKAVEYMITDAMVEANAVWGRRLSNAIQSPEEYCKLSDAVVQEIEYSSDPAMAKAQGILKDLRRRILYKFVDEFIIPQELAERLPKIKPIDITTMNQSGDVQLEEDDVIVHDHKLNYGNKDRDPLSTTRFYRESEESSFLIDRSKVSYILPAQYEERVVRVYSRRQGTHLGALHAACALTHRLHCVVQTRKCTRRSSRRSAAYFASTREALHHRPRTRQACSSLLPAAGWTHRQCPASVGTAFQRLRHLARAL